MIIAATVTRGAWTALLLGAVLAGAAWLAPIAKRPTAPEAGGELAALAAEREQLRGNEDPVRDQWRQRRAALTQHAWTHESLAQIQAQFGAGWRWQWRDQDHANLQRLQPRLEDWPDYVALVTALGEKPGLVVESLAVRAEGAARSRRFTALSLDLRFMVADASVQQREPHAPEPVPVSFRPDPSGPSAGITTKQNPQETSP